MVASSDFSVHLYAWNEAMPLTQPLREQVFVIEQKVPIELEWDEFDAVSRHAIAFNTAGEAIGTGRLLPDGHLGRMAVLPAWRGRGVGRLILNSLIAEATRLGIQQLVLHAQTHAVSFYRACGFIAAGEEFMEAGIPHLKMTRTRKQSEAPRMG